MNSNVAVPYTVRQIRGEHPQAAWQVRPDSPRSSSFGITVGLCYCPLHGRGAKLFALHAAAIRVIAVAAARHAQQPRRLSNSHSSIVVEVQRSRFSAIALTERSAREGRFARD